MSEGEPHEIVLVTRPVGATAEPSSMETLRQVFSTSFGLASTAAAAVTAVVEDAAGAALDATLGAALDRIVPVVTDAIVDRLDLTEIVLSRVDLNMVVNRALDSLDLTQLVLDRVDINAVVAEADFDSIIDRVPVVPLANYVIGTGPRLQMTTDSKTFNDEVEYLWKDWTRKTHLARKFKTSRMARLGVAG